MQFKKFSGRAASFNFVEGEKVHSQDGLVFVDKIGLDLATHDSSHPANRTVEEVLLFLSLCHSIVIDKRSGKMNSASPDELALVEGASAQGFQFRGKDGSERITIERKRDGTLLKFALLNTLEFNSTRKRMSVIVRDLQTNEILLLCKGADSVIKQRLDLTVKPEDAAFLARTQQYVDLYAEEGLRTLLLAKKPVSPQVYEEWNKKYVAASTAVINKEETMEAVQSEIEQELLLVGSTAIEDRLQENVKETIEAFKEAGVKVWVLTGDKVETAINIGFSCGLLNKEMV